MRFKKTIFVSFTILVIFLTYIYFRGSKVNYVVLGDSLAAGQNPYGEIGYSYADYIRDYLDSNNELKNYVKEYAVSGYKIEDVLNDLKWNKKVVSDSREVNLRSLLRESNLVTISLGANDFLKNFSPSSLQFDDFHVYNDAIQVILQDFDQVLKEIRKYAKEDIYVLGYYNPFPSLFQNYEEQIDMLFSYIDSSYEEICHQYDVTYVPIYQLFKDHPEYLPNPFDIHPNLQGYSAIASKVIQEHLQK